MGCAADRADRIGEDWGRKAALFALQPASTAGNNRCDMKSAESTLVHRTLLELSPAAIVVIDEAGLVSFATAAATRTFGHALNLDPAVDRLHPLATPHEH